MADLREFDGPEVRGPALVRRSWPARAVLWLYFRVVWSFGKWVDRLFG